MFFYRLVKLFVVKKVVFLIQFYNYIIFVVLEENNTLLSEVTKTESSV